MQIIGLTLRVPTWTIRWGVSTSAVLWMQLPNRNTTITLLCGIPPPSYVPTLKKKRLLGVELPRFKLEPRPHRSPLTRTIKAAREHQPNLLIFRGIGMIKSRGVDHCTRIRVYAGTMDRYFKGLAHLALLPVAMWMAEPKQGRPSRYF